MSGSNYLDVKVWTITKLNIPYTGIYKKIILNVIGGITDIQFKDLPKSILNWKCISNTRLYLKRRNP